MLKLAFKARSTSATDSTAKSSLLVNKSPNSPSRKTEIMSYPIIPLVPNWDSTKSEQSNIIVTKYQPNTIEARSSRTKINTTNVTFSVSVNITNGTAVDTFLRERNGKAFRVENDTMLYSCTEWTIQALGEGVDLFSATFEQVRRFL